MTQFPRWVYRPGWAPRLIHTPQELAELTPEWTDSPAPPAQGADPHGDLSDVGV